MNWSGSNCNFLPKWITFGPDQFILVMTISFWSWPDHYGQVQISLVKPKPFWTDQICFGHIEGQGSRVFKNPKISKSDSNPKIGVFPVSGQITPIPIIAKPDPTRSEFSKNFYFLYLRKGYQDIAIDCPGLRCPNQKWSRPHGTTYSNHNLRCQPIQGWASRVLRL